MLEQEAARANEDRRQALEQLSANQEILGAQSAALMHEIWDDNYHAGFDLGDLEDELETLVVDTGVIPWPFLPAKAVTAVEPYCYLSTNEQIKRYGSCIPDGINDCETATVWSCACKRGTRGCSIDHATGKSIYA